MMLERSGYRVVDVQSAEDAIRQFNAMESVDLLVSDVVMPGMSGVELFDTLVERLPSLRALFISGSVSYADIEPEIAGKRAAFLEKPFSAGALADTLRELLR
jgi:two-component system cell cycle sensor histidine kinase/response regulator CckA